MPRKREAPPDRKCDHCFRVFRSKPCLALHLENRNCAGLWICDGCHLVLRKNGAMAAHLCMPDFHCDDCGSSLGDRTRMMAHALRLHLAYSGPRFWHCDDCAFQCKRNMAMQRHVDWCGAEQAGQVSCDVCLLACENREALAKHLFSQHGIVPKSLTGKLRYAKAQPFLACEVCSQTMRKFALFGHWINRHGGEKAGRLRAESRTLRQRQMRIRRARRGLIHCDDCGSFFNKPLSLLAHQNKCSGQKFVIRNHHLMHCVCDTCEEVFKVRLGLIRHTRLHFPKLPLNKRKYGPVKRFFCDECIQVERSLMGLIRHLGNRHRLKFPFLRQAPTTAFHCDACQYRGHRDSYTSHWLSVHSSPGVRTARLERRRAVEARRGFVACDDCQRCFSRSLLGIHRCLERRRKRPLLA